MKQQYIKLQKDNSKLIINEVNYMNKLLILIKITVLLAAGITIGCIDRILMRSPILVMNNALITFVSGEANFKKEGDNNWNKAAKDIVLKGGSELKTGKKGKIDLTLNDGTAIRIKENAHFVINEINMQKVKIKLNKGAFYGKFRRLHLDQKIHINTVTAECGVRGTKLAFEVLEPGKKDDKDGEGKEGEDTKNDKAVTIYGISGILEIMNPKFPDDKLLLSYKKKTVVSENSPPIEPVKITNRKFKQIQKIIYSIHTDEEALETGSIMFHAGNAKIKTESYKELNRIAKMIKGKTSIIRIQGHTARFKGAESNNQVLSEKRAGAVRKYLIKKGIMRSRLIAVGFGSSKPIADNKTAEGRAKNRRVEFIIED